MKTNQEKINETMFLVEADDFSRLALWEKFNTRLDWKEDIRGFWTEIRTIDHRPICVSIFWAVIDGQRVAFYYGTSQLVDHEMIENWIKKTFNYPLAHCNAMNFHLCLDAINEANVRK